MNTVRYVLRSGEAVSQWEYVEMKCFKCNRTFEPSEEEWQHAREIGQKGFMSTIECRLPKFCCWDCFKIATHFKSHGNKERMRKAKERNRWSYHIGELPPMPGTPDARSEEEAYRQKMVESCRKRPPRVGYSGFSDGSMINPMVLPSEALLGTSKRRVLDECTIHMGGEDGDNFNFPNE